MGLADCDRSSSSSHVRSRSSIIRELCGIGIVAGITVSRSLY
ncbi:MAG: hypothetical protein QNJ55_34950 [Xenococcus sp. MO_188.B8]|nr:hypothetical protein [Xenococcus sp. MO_188.B8]